MSVGLRLLRASMPYAIALAVAFALGVAGGFVYAHKPATRTLEVRVDRSTPVDTANEATVAGHVALLEGSRITIETADGPLEFELGGVSLEQLVRAGDSGLDVGTGVNVGGEQTPFGLALSGIVAIEDGRSP